MLLWGMWEEIKNKLNKVAGKYKWLNSLRLIVSFLVFLYSVVSYLVTEVINWTPTNETSRALAMTMHLPHHPYVFWPFMIISGIILILSIIRRPVKEKEEKKSEKESLANEISFLLAEMNAFKLERKSKVTQPIVFPDEYARETLILFSEKFSKKIIVLRNKLMEKGTRNEELDRCYNSYSRISNIGGIQRGFENILKELA